MKKNVKIDTDFIRPFRFYESAPWVLIITLYMNDYTYENLSGIKIDYFNKKGFEETYSSPGESVEANSGMTSFRNSNINNVIYSYYSENLGDGYTNGYRHATRQTSSENAVYESIKIDKVNIYRTFANKYEIILPLEASEQIVRIQEQLSNLYFNFYVTDENQHTLWYSKPILLGKSLIRELNNLDAVVNERYLSLYVNDILKTATLSLPDALDDDSPETLDPSIVPEHLYIKFNEGRLSAIQFANLYRASRYAGIGSNIVIGLLGDTYDQESSDSYLDNETYKIRFQVKYGDRLVQLLQTGNTYDSVRTFNSLFDFQSLNLLKLKISGDGNISVKHKIIDLLDDYFNGNQNYDFKIILEILKGDPGDVLTQLEHDLSIGSSNDIFNSNTGINSAASLTYYKEYKKNQVKNKIILKFENKNDLLITKHAIDVSDLNEEDCNNIRISKIIQNLSSDQTNEFTYVYSKLENNSLSNVVYFEENLTLNSLKNILTLEVIDVNKYLIFYTYTGINGFIYPDFDIRFVYRINQNVGEVEFTISEEQININIDSTVSYIEDTNDINQMIKENLDFSSENAINSTIDSGNLFYKNINLIQIRSLQQLLVKSQKYGYDQDLISFINNMIVYFECKLSISSDLMQNVQEPVYNKFYFFSELFNVLESDFTFASNLNFKSDMLSDNFNIERLTGLNNNIIVSGENSNPPDGNFNIDYKFIFYPLHKVLYNDKALSLDNMYNVLGSNNVDINLIFYQNYFDVAPTASYFYDSLKRNFFSSGNLRLFDQFRNNLKDNVNVDASKISSYSDYVPLKSIQTGNS